MRPHWDAKAATWEDHLPRTDLFAELVDTVMDAVTPSRADVVVDLGAGTGFLTIPIAERTKRVYAVDHSSAMLDRLHLSLDGTALRVRTVQADVRAFTPPEPIDVVVSNYALHHLRRRGKDELLASCRTWLRPGGRIAISDLMVPLTLRPGQSGPLIEKVGAIARKGPAGWVRLAKNAIRWAAGRGEYPEAVEFWMDALRRNGFIEVDGRRVGDESGVAWGRNPR